MIAGGSRGGITSGLALLISRNDGPMEWTLCVQIESSSSGGSVAVS